MTRVGYLGPEGTFSHEALVAQPGVDALELVSLATVYDTVMAVDDGRVDRAFVPMENSLEGSVNVTLDTLALETDGVAIVGEFVHPVHQCLIARRAIDTDRIATVLSHPQANAQCARFLRTELPQASVVAVNSTAEAVRTVAERDGPTAALGTRLSAELYGCRVLRAGVEDVDDNETRFVWLARGESHPGDGPAKTSVVFWGAGSERPGWLARCLTEFAQREVSLTKIESRPRKVGLGRYMFFLDCEGGVEDAGVAAALEGVGSHVDTLKVLGSYPAA
ncbi:MAG TPA: prephenate dehydratase [Solirubrobacteraceae bacterium]|nr:prephenate dehydratase [Solirubrobacteraceae bacterium]